MGQFLQRPKSLAGKSGHTRFCSWSDLRLQLWESSSSINNQTLIYELNHGYAKKHIMKGETIIMKRYWIPSVFFCLLTAALALGTTRLSSPKSEAVYDVRDYGAKADGKTLCTKSIQAAIDKCAADGGGTVYLPPGNWLSGTIYMENYVTLLLDSGSTLLGSRDPNDYAHPYTPGSKSSQGQSFSYWSLIAGTSLEHIAIRGRGTIDGQGSAFRFKDRSRPKGIYLENCRDVLVEDLEMRNAGSWMQHYRNCDRLSPATLGPDQNPPLAGKTSQYSTTPHTTMTASISIAAETFVSPDVLWIQTMTQ